MNRNAIKIIAAITMVSDHIGLLLIDPTSVLYYVLRLIGRIAFVLFAYMIAEGYFKTKDLKKYFLRLFAFALAVEIFLIGYYFVTDINYTVLGDSANVIWPLVFGLAALALIGSNRIIIRFTSILLVFLAEFIGFPYGAYGVLTIMIFGLYTNKLTQFLFFAGINLLFINVPLLTYLDLGQYAKYDWFQWFSLFAFIFIYFYNGKRGKLNTKWFFYIFYPLHLGIIYLIGYLL